VGGEAPKTPVKKRQDFGSTEGCEQSDSVEQQEREGRRKKTTPFTVLTLFGSWILDSVLPFSIIIHLYK